MMKKDELKPGDLVVLKSGYIAMLVENEHCRYFLFSKGGWEDIEGYSDDLTCKYEDDMVMQVWRALGYGAGFSDFEYDMEPVYVRDENWVRPTEEEMARAEAEAEAKRKELMAKRAEKAAQRKAENKEELIFIMIQAFYGNRTGTEIRPSQIDGLILGYVPPFETIRRPIDRTIIRLPDSQQVVLVYNRFQEEEALAKKARWFEESQYVAKPLAVVPELNLELYSRCLACRMDEDGSLKSLEPEDRETVLKHLCP